MNWRRLTGVLLLANALVLIVYDFAARASGGTTATISDVITTTSKEYLLIPVTFGILIGHLFFSQKEDKQ